MQVEIVRGPAGFGSLDGAAVVIDVFRASNTIIALLSAGAERVYLLADLDQARRLGAENPSWLLLGERGGRMAPGFAGDNSPAATAGMDLAGRTVILTTSAGTQEVHLLARAREIFYAGFSNMSAVVGVLEDLRPKVVHILPMGLGAVQAAEEDDLAADYLAAVLQGRRPDFGPVARRLNSSTGARRLRSLGLHEDLIFCTNLDSHRLVPRVERSGAHPYAVSWPPAS